MTQLVCYNRGCGNKFSEAENDEDVCQHHPGAPVFHDAYKGWSCCNKKTTDFTEFLNIKGCTKGKHSNVKPVEPEKNKVAQTETAEPRPPKPPAPKQAIERPSTDAPKVRLKSKIAASLKDALNRFHQRQKENSKGRGEGDEKDVIAVGAPCKRNGCNVLYCDESSNFEDCVYHEGYPVFHEGMKFWTCCRRRTSDFDEFLKQPGCQNGSHQWLKPSEVAEKKSTCRYDWHQTGPFVYISLYAKVCDPEKSYVEVNQANISIKLAFNGGINIFELQLPLFDLIIPDGSYVEFMGTKVEIKLRKENVFAWKTLEHQS